MTECRGIRSLVDQVAGTDKRGGVTASALSGAQQDKPLALRVMSLLTIQNGGATHVKTTGLFKEMYCSEICQDSSNRV